MANEIIYGDETGLTLTTEAYYKVSGTLTLRDTIALTEQPSGSGLYKGSSTLVQEGDYLRTYDATRNRGFARYYPLSDATISKLEGMIEDVSGDRFTEKALEKGLAGGGSGGGSGANTINYRVYTDEDNNTGPIGEVKVWVTSDLVGNTTVASGYTDDFGLVTFYLDSGTYYFWRKKGGYTFTNPDTEVIG